VAVFAWFPHGVGPSSTPTQGGRSFRKFYLQMCLVAHIDVLKVRPGLKRRFFLDLKNGVAELA
jgi:hypothetical protein